MAEFLLDIYTEEIPTSYQAPAARALKKAICDGLTESGFLDPAAQPTVLHSSRHLVLHVPGVLDREPDRTEEMTGPPADKGFDSNGKPTKTALGFARSKGVSPDDLFVKETPKGKYCAATVTVKGKTAADVLAVLVRGAISDVPFPKNMWWGIGGREFPKLTYARPIRRIAAVLDAHVVEFSIGSLKSGRTTMGHFFADPVEIEIASADLDAYLAEMKKHYVVVSREERAAILGSKAEGFLGGAVLGRPDLMDTVVNLVECPNLVEGTFDESFLELPPTVVSEVLVSHQKYFPVRKSDDDGLEPRFLAVFDRPDDADLDAIRRGAERVVGARLADARFFWENDRKKRIDERIADLKVQTFHDKLGDYLLKTERLTELAGFIAAELGFDAHAVDKARRAAGLSKADLTTNMVYEFPGLQGTMGMIYAQADGADEDVARAVGEQYLLEPGPQTVLGKVLSLADRFDNIVGYFALGEVPTSSGDPHGLRRQALAAIETIDSLGAHPSTGGPLLLSSVIAEAARLHGFVKKDGTADPDAYAAADLDEFLRDRIYYHLSRDTSCRPELIRAVLAAGFDDAHDLKKRLAAVIELSGTEHWEKLAELVERTFKIGRAADLSGDVNEDLLEEAQEKAVWKVLNDARPEIQALFDSGDYRRGSDLYREKLAGPVHKFFDEVYVNVDDRKVRNNRMLLMRQVYDLYAASVADLSLVPGGS